MPKKTSEKMPEKVAPTIVSVVATPNPATPGQTVNIKTVATDPDTQTFTAEVTVTDASGLKAVGTGQIPVSDPLTYACVIKDKNGVVVATALQDPIDKSLFHWTVPA